MDARPSHLHTATLQSCYIEKSECEKFLNKA